MYDEDEDEYDDKQTNKEVNQGMYLQDAIAACEQKGYSIALDLGLHKYCLLDSNCPKAIQVRQMISDMQISQVDLLTGYAEVTSIPDDPVKRTDFLLGKLKIDGKLNLSIGGTVVPIDLSAQIKELLKDELSKIDLNEEKRNRQINLAADALFTAYKDAIRQAKQHKELEQLNLDIKDVLRFGIVTTAYNGYYLFFYPMVYQPGYLYDNGDRYEICEQDKLAIRRENCWIKFEVNKERKFIDITLVNQQGLMLNHYHGRPGFDCWGTMHKPEKWDGSLEMLAREAKSRIGALGMINMNSLLDRHPDGMPIIQEVKNRATKMGREGEIKVKQPSEDIMEALNRASEQVRNNGSPRPWGARSV